MISVWRNTKALQTIAPRRLWERLGDSVCVSGVPVLGYAGRVKGGQDAHDLQKSFRVEYRPFNLNRQMISFFLTLLGIVTT
jgi:hypothetical protein